MAATGGARIVGRKAAQRLAQVCQFRIRQRAVSRLLPRPHDAPDRIRVLRTHAPVFGQGTQPGHQCQRPVAHGRPVGQVARQPFDIRAGQIGDPAPAEGRKQVAPRLLPILGERPVRHPPQGDPLRGKFGLEALPEIGEGGRLPRFLPPRQRILAIPDPCQQVAGALAGRPEGHFGRPADRGTTLPAPDPVIEDVRPGACQGYAQAEAPHLPVPDDPRLRAGRGVPDDLLGQVHFGPVSVQCQRIADIGAKPVEFNGSRKTHKVLKTIRKSNHL